MKHKLKTGVRLCILILTLILVLSPIGTVFAAVAPSGSIAVNQIGYYPDGAKLAVLDGGTSVTKFYVVNAKTQEVVFGANAQRIGGGIYADFSAVTETGKFYLITSHGSKSPVFTISNDVYRELTDALVKFFYYQRCGTAVENAGEISHPACHTWESMLYDPNGKFVKMVDAVGGWHDAGDYGRFFYPQAIAVYQLLLAYDVAPALFGDDSGIPESGNGVADILDEARWELDWIHKVQGDDGGFYLSASSRDFISTRMPEEDHYETVSHPATTESTAKGIAVMAFAYEIFKDIDPEYAEKCLKSAEFGWEYMDAHPNGQMKYVNGIPAYTDEGKGCDRDDIYWAAAQMFKATNEKKYLDLFKKMYAELGAQHELGWGGAGGNGTVAFLDTESDLIDDTFRSRVKSEYLRKVESTALKNAKENVYHTADVTWWWGSNMMMANAGFKLYTAGKYCDRPDLYIAGGQQIDYLLGTNTHDISFVTGYGSNVVIYPHHGPSVASGGYIMGALVGGAYEKEDFYEDSDQNYYCNEPSCYYNSALIVTIAYSSVCKNTPEEILPENQNVLDVKGMKLEEVLNGNKKPTPTSTSTEAPTETDATEPEKKGCKSSVSSAALVAAVAFIPAICTVAHGEKKRKRK